MTVGFPRAVPLLTPTYPVKYVNVWFVGCCGTSHQRVLGNVLGLMVRTWFQTCAPVQNSRTVEEEALEGGKWKGIGEEEEGEGGEGVEGREGGLGEKELREGGGGGRGRRGRSGGREEDILCHIMADRQV